MVELRVEKYSIEISNNIGGQLGPDTICHAISWKQFFTRGIRWC